MTGLEVARAAPMAQRLEAFSLRAFGLCFLVLALEYHALILFLWDLLLKGNHYEIKRLCSFLPAYFKAQLFRFRV